MSTKTAFIQGIQHLRANLVHPRHSATSELFDYLSDFRQGNEAEILIQPCLNVSRNVLWVQVILKLYRQVWSASPHPNLQQPGPVYSLPPV